MVLVLRCADLEATRRFYEAHGLSFSREQHGVGPVHYAHADGQFVLELYPARDADGKRVDDVMLIVDTTSPETKPQTLTDPDGRHVRIARGNS
jgi:hypothetical protein